MKKFATEKIILTVDFSVCVFSLVLMSQNKPYKGVNFYQLKINGYACAISLQYTNYQ